MKKAISVHQKKLNKSNARLIELRKVTKALYEDKIKGTISEDDFKFMNGDHAAERKVFEAEIIDPEAEIEALKEKTSGADKFIALAKKYTNISELNIELVNTFIEKIIVHEKVRAEGKTSQKIEFVFKGIGKVDLGELGGR